MLPLQCLLGLTERADACFVQQIRLGLKPQIQYSYAAWRGGVHLWEEKTGDLLSPGAHKRSAVVGTILCFYIRPNSLPLSESILGTA